MKPRGLITFVLLACFANQLYSQELKMEQTPRKIVIAHRGASGYLPEHTLEAKAMAYAMHVDYLEQDLVLSKDNVPVVIHDIYLDDLTDVAAKYPAKKRGDGRYYVIDFTYDELKQLKVTERFNPKTDKAVFEDRFPLWKSDFRLHSLQDEIELIQGLNNSTGGNIGIYPEIKDPEFHNKEGRDISKIVLKILAEYGYTTKKDKCIIQCFDANELKRIREELKSELFLVQLLETRKEQKDLEKYATYTDGIGPWYKNSSPDFIKKAHELGLVVHAYTFRADDLGKYKSFDELLNYGFNTLGLDGIFTDFPDRAVHFLEIRQ